MCGKELKCKYTRIHLKPAKIQCSSDLSKIIIEIMQCRVEYSRVVLQSVFSQWGRGRKSKSHDNALPPAN